MHGAKFVLFLALLLLLSSVASSRAAAPPAYAFNLSEHSDLAGIDEATPAAASGPEGCLVVWKDNRASNQPYHRGEYRLYGRRFDSDGTPLDAASFAVQDEPFLWNNEGLTQPSVGSLGRGHLVVWLTRLRHISARWISPEGIPASNELAIARTGDASGQPALATSARGALIAWTSRTNNNGDIYATLLDRRGRVTGVVPIATDSGNAQHPTVASAGRDFLVVWRELLPSGTGVIKAAIVRHDGNVRHLHEFPARSVDWITAAANGRSYFVAWQTCGTTSPDNHLMGTLLSPTGRIRRDEVMLAACGHEQILPVALRSGSNFTVSWREDPYTAQARMFALTVTARGHVKTSAMPVRGERGWDGYGSAAQLDKSKILVVLEQKTPAYYENGYLSRVRGNVFQQAP